MERKSTGGMHVGTSSVLVAFVLLCLVTFAGLSYLSASSDYRLSRQTADKTSEYYNAGSEADRRLSELDDIFREMAQGTSEASYFSALEDRFSTDEVYSFRTDGADHNLSFTTPVNDRQNLSVEIKLLFPASAQSPSFDITSYCVTVNSSWQDEIRDEIDEHGLLY